MFVTLFFLSCNEDIKYASSDPSNCTAEFCEEDFDEGSGGSQDTENPSTDDVEDTDNENDTADFEDTADSNNDNQQDTAEGYDGESETGYEHEDSGFHKESEECGCANPEGGLSFFIFFSFFGLWRREKSHS